jgi:hypothetical protein
VIVAKNRNGATATVTVAIQIETAVPAVASPARAVNSRRTGFACRRRRAASPLQMAEEDA